ncbi:MAG TPA: dolichyl-phosphate beta-glucosyltransferase [Candidatus Dormibacteraeota bacterium]
MVPRQPPRPWLSVVIPAYNEESRLPRTLAAILSHLRLRGRPFEVIVADDGSVDGTGAVAAAAGPEIRVLRLAHAGKGAAVRAGVLATSGELVLLSDADLSTPVEELERLRAAIWSGAGLAIGSRRLGSSRVGVRQPLPRRVMGAVFNLFVRALVLPGISDTQCGFKLFRGDLARRVFSAARVDGFAFDVEAILLASQLGERVAEVPVAWHDSRQSRVRPLRDALAMFVELLRIRRSASSVRLRQEGVTVRRARPWGFRQPLRETAAVFWLALAVYLAAGAYFALHEHLIARDAYARVAIAHRILFSRDPHLAAIGFVWSPMPVIALLPLVPLKWLVRPATDYGFVADIVSAVCMAGTAREICAFLREMGAGRTSRLALSAAFTIHPLILLYAANGMSEAMFLLFLVVATRRFAGWLRTGDIGVGVGAGVALAAAYLTRYEALIAGVATVGLAAAVTYWRTSGGRRRRRSQAFADAVVIGLPLALAVVAWVVASWAITGSPMEQFSSTYGNSAQLSVKALRSPGVGGWTAYAATQLVIVEPFVAGLVALGVLGALRRGGSPAMLAIAGVIGVVLTFMAWSNARGLIDHELRYMIVAVPLAVLAVGPVFGRAGHRAPRLAGVAAGVASLGMVVAALPVSAVELANGYLNPGDAAQVRAIVYRHGAVEQQAAPRFTTERQMAADLDALDLPRDTVLLDDFLGFAIPLSSRNPGQFVITSDRDFQSILTDPTGNRVRYLVVPEPVEQGRLDALNRRYASLYADGAGMATLVRQYGDTDNRTSWRLYRMAAAPEVTR